jgi:hypothetical protein
MKRLIGFVSLVVFSLSVLSLLVVLNYLAYTPEFRARIDATKTRAYSLSQQTQNLLTDLDGQWTIALVMVQSDVDRAARRQVDEVLGRFTAAAPNIDVVRIDPTDPHTLADYEAILADLRVRYAETVSEYDHHLDANRAAFEDTLLFAQQQAAMLEQFVLAAEDAGISEQLLRQPVQRKQTLALRAEQGTLVLEELDKARRVHDTQPIPDYELARNIMAQVVEMTANELYETYEQFGEWLQMEAMPIELRSFASANRSAHEQRARDLAIVVDPLRHLPPLELATIGTQLASGEAAVILSPERATVIPSSQLFPRSNFRRGGDGVITFDQRFRGEQLLAAAMRSLLVEHMPMVVFMHAEERSLLQQRDQRADLIGVATMLNASRFDVQQWNVVTGERPSPQRGQPVVWVPIAPPNRTSLEITRNEQALLNQVQRLLADGEPVLLSMYPSLLPRYGQPDPWADLAAPLGLKVDTSRVVYESFRTAADQIQTQRSQLLQRFEPGHPVARAVHGQQAHFPLPVPIQASPDVAAGTQHTVLAVVRPDVNRWLEPNWSVDPDSLERPRDDQRFDQPLPVVMAATRPHPIQRSEQRVMLVGCGGWMLTFIADDVVPIGGDRVALASPGNHELMLASVAWLAGMDELIAQSPTGQEVARLDEISEGAGQRWFWFIVVLMPAGCLGLGLVVWGMRRT